MKTKEFVKTATVICLLSLLKRGHDDLQKEAKYWRDDWSLEDIPIEDIKWKGDSCDRMIMIITELKRRIDAYKIHVKALEESQPIEN